MKAILIDGSPLKGESVSIVVKAGTYGRYGSCYGRRACKELMRRSFTVPASGIVDFVVPGSNITEETKSLFMQVSSKLIISWRLT